MRVRLDELEYRLGMAAGSFIHGMSRRAGLRDGMIAGQSEADSLLLNQKGQLGELVVAKALDLFWGGSAWSFGKPDLSHNIEVRTLSPESQVLKVRMGDDDLKRVVGVRLPKDLEHGEYELVGWIYAGHGQKRIWLDDPFGAGRPYYRVPLSELRPIEELRLLVNEERSKDWW